MDILEYIHKMKKSGEAYKEVAKTPEPETVTGKLAKAFYLRLLDREMREINRQFYQDTKI